MSPALSKPRIVEPKVPRAAAEQGLVHKVRHASIKWPFRLQLAHTTPSSRVVFLYMWPLHAVFGRYVSVYFGTAPRSIVPFLGNAFALLLTLGIVYERRCCRNRNGHALLNLEHMFF